VLPGLTGSFPQVLNQWFRLGLSSYHTVIFCKGPSKNPRIKSESINTFSRGNKPTNQKKNSQTKKQLPAILTGKGKTPLFSSIKKNL